MKSFVSRYAAFIYFILSGFDRLRFRGESMLLSNPQGVDSYLYRRGIRYVDFMDHCQQLTAQLKHQTEQLADDQGLRIIHLNSPRIDKEATALNEARKQPRSAANGCIAILTAVESCMTYRLRKNPEGKAYPLKEEGKCKHYYHYFQHPEYGLCYVRLQTYFPFTVRVGMNGRQWLYQQLRQKDIHFTHRDNLLLSVENVPLAQRLMVQQRQTNFIRLLGRLVKPVQPLWSFLQTHAPYHWMAEQTEFATDFVFHRQADLARCYERWLQHGIQTLNCTDVLRYLGKKHPRACGQEVKMDLRQREEGMRLKFWHGTNSLKMYDKQGISFRVETTINQPKEFNVYRPSMWQPESEPTWRQMSKSVIDLGRRAEVSESANGRLLESLSTVAEPTTLGELLKPLGKPVKHQGQRVARALNPLTGQDGELLRTLAHGEYLLRGFRNADLREALWGKTRDAQEERRRSAAMTRLLALLRAHGIIVKVKASHRYLLSKFGHRLVTALATAHNTQVLAA